MKKIFLSSGLILIALMFNVVPLPVKASTATVVSSTVKQQVKTKKIVKKKTTKKKIIKAKVAVKTTAKTTLKWDASALKIINNLAGFDHSVTIRNAYVKKVENYARRNKIKVITAAVINSMRE
jgi:predicted alpha/beta-fold hydrolase